MKKVLKGQEPPLLASYRTSNPRNTWEQFSKKSGRKVQVQKQLRTDLGGLCAYCEIDLLEVDDDEESVADFRVEHFHPKSTTVAGGHNWHLDWNNLLGCCHGGSKSDVRDANQRFTSPDHSCDVPKGSKNLTGTILNPSTDIPAFPGLFKCDRSSGKLSVNTVNCSTTGINPVLAQNTIDELRLDAGRLNRFRRKVLNELNDRLRQMVQNGVPIPQARSQLAQVYLRKNTQQHWPAFFSSIRDYLGDEAEQHLRAMGYQG